MPFKTVQNLRTMYYSASDTGKLGKKNLSSPNRRRAYDLATISSKFVQNLLLKDTCYQTYRYPGTVAPRQTVGVKKHSKWARKTLVKKS